MYNEDINEEINRGNFQGKSHEEMKPLYIKRNSFDASGEIDIFRIYESKYFLEDIKNSIITLVNISPLVFGDPLENPILNKEFSDGRDKFTLGFLENYYGLSWTEEPEDQEWRWEAFTHGGMGVRVKVNLGKFLDRYFDIQDQFFMLHYYVGKVSYHDAQQIEFWRDNSHYSQFLDSLGQLSALSLTALRNDFSEENEIRILYSYMHNDNDFVSKEVSVSGILCKIPFDWQGIVDEVLYDSRMSELEINDLKNTLKSAGIKCSVQRSSVVLK